MECWAYCYFELKDFVILWYIDIKLYISKQKVEIKHFYLHRQVEEFVADFLASI